MKGKRTITVTPELQETISSLSTDDLEKLVDKRYEIGASQEELNFLETEFAGRVSEEDLSITEEDLSISEGISVQEQLVNMYHRYLDPELRQGMGANDILSNMRAVIETAGGKESIADEQLLFAAKDIYAHRQNLLRKLKAKPIPERGTIHILYIPAHSS